MPGVACHAELSIDAKYSQLTIEDQQADGQWFGGCIAVNQRPRDVRGDPPRSISGPKIRKQTHDRDQKRINEIRTVAEPESGVDCGAPSEIAGSPAVAAVPELDEVRMARRSEAHARIRQSAPARILGKSIRSFFEVIIGSGYAFRTPGS